MSRGLALVLLLCRVPAWTAERAAPSAPVLAQPAAAVMLDRAAAQGPQGKEMFISRQKMGRLGTADEIASMAVYLGSDESAFTTGVDLVVDGGYML